MCSPGEIIIVVHGGYLNDLPLLIANCMKQNFNYHKFDRYKFVDSMKIFQNRGYIRAGLDTLCLKTNITRCKYHSAVKDVEYLQYVVNQLLDGDLIELFRSYWFTLNDVLLFVEEKLPISVERIKELSISVMSRESFKCKLAEYVSKKTALSKEQLSNIVDYYFKIQ